MYAFRVRPRAQLQPSSMNTSEPVPAPLNTRRAHNKSRHGCENCKQRRKKCDETRPICSLCAKKNLGCIYPGPDPRKVWKPNIRPTIWPGPHSPAVLANYSSQITHTQYDLFLIDHFVHTAAQYFEAPDYRGVYSVKAIQLAKDYPFLMHAMIAVAACHLQHLPIDAKRYRIPEAFHCQLASRGLRMAVTSINGPKESDSVLTTAMLVNCLAFCAADYRDEDQTDMDGGPRWDWLRISIGITDLLIRTKPFHPESIWLPMFATTKNWRIPEPPQNDLDKQLATFCGIDQDSTPYNNPYFDFWKETASIVTQPANMEYMRLYINAIGGIDHAFIALLEKKDTKALLLFAHWAALMCSVGSWWSLRRTKRACWAVCQILARQMNEGDLWLMESPASACGFPFALSFEDVHEEGKFY